MKKLLLTILVFLFTANVAMAASLEFKEQGDVEIWAETGLNESFIDHAVTDVNNDFGYESIGVRIYFNEDGGRMFEEITERNIGKQLAIFVDGALISSPTIQEAITGGEAVIAGNFTVEEANQLVTDLGFPEGIYKKQFSWLDVFRRWFSGLF